MSLTNKIYKTGNVLYDHVDLVASVIFGWSLNDHGGQTLGEYRGFVEGASAAIAVAPYAIDYFRGNYDYHRFTRNITAALGSLVFFWPIGTRRQNNLSFQLFHQAFGILCFYKSIRQELKMIESRKTKKEKVTLEAILKQEII